MGDAEVGLFSIAGRPRARGASVRGAAWVSGVAMSSAVAMGDHAFVESDGRRAPYNTIASES